MIIMKFGGTSMGSKASLQNVTKIIQKNLHEQPIIVVSAMSGITDQLIALAESALKSSHLSQKHFDDIKNRHFATVSELFGTSKSTQIFHQKTIDDLTQKFEVLQQYITGISLIKELSPHSFDFITSYGERLSTIILSNYLNSVGIKSTFIMGDEFLVTTDCPGSGEPLIAESKKKGRTKITNLVKAGKTPVITGFFGKSINGHINTLGRGGSDYSASIVGAVVNAKEVQIWTDVSGIYTTDPRVCSDAKPHKIISFREASELAHFGAKVIHPRTILPAVENKIPIFIKNTFHPEQKGTEITFNENKVPRSIKAIAFKKGITLITVETSEMLMTYGFLAKVFDIFAKHDISVDLIATSEVSISISVENKEITKLVKDLQTTGQVHVHKNQCIISVVGNGLHSNLKHNVKIIEALAKLKIAAKIITQGATQNNFSIVVDESVCNTAVTKIHDKLFPTKK